jgi:transketolase
VREPRDPSAPRDPSRHDPSALDPSAPLEPPYATELKPYGRALVELARDNPAVLCLSGDLTRQCEADLFQEAFPERFIHGGMAEANMIGVAAALARKGFQPWVHTFGVFATRRPLDQIINAVAYPALPVRIVGFMPGVSSPGGPSHQAIDDVALMRALPNMTVVDVADAVETRQAVRAIAGVDGPVYLRLKRGEIPVIFGADHEFRLDKATVLTRNTVSIRNTVITATSGSRGPDSRVPDSRRDPDAALFASGMMLAPALAAARVLETVGVAVRVVGVPVIKPLDTATVLEAAAAARVIVTAENHLVTGGLGSAVAEAVAEAGLGRPLRRIGLRDTFAEGALTSGYLFEKYGLSTQSVIDTIWAALARPGRAPAAPEVPAEPGEYSPV